MHCPYMKLVHWLMVAELVNDAKGLRNTIFLYVFFSVFQIRSVGRLKRERSMSENASRQNGQLIKNESL